MAKLPHKFTYTRKRKRLSMRIREGLAVLDSLGYRSRDTPEAIWLETPKVAYVFDPKHFGKRKAHEFHAWYLSHASTKAALPTLPIGIIARTIVRRDWSAIPAASAGRLAPIHPIKPMPTGCAAGSNSTVPGHLAELDTYDLRKR